MKLFIKIVAILFMILTTFAYYTGQNISASALPFSWPPKVGEEFPNLKLTDINGKEVSLSSFKGKVLIVEPIGMSCQACNAFSGGQQKGGYKGIQPQQGLDAFELYFYQYAKGVSFNDPNLIFVQLILYNPELKAPGVDEIKAWSEHFGFTDRSNIYVLAAGSDMQNQASYNMIPGFFLIDKNFRLRFDSTGHSPKHNLFTELLPSIPTLLKE